jgi:hypothetical protein
MQLGWARRSKEFIPGIRPESNHACETSLNIAKLYSTYQPCKVRAERAQSGIRVLLAANADNQEDGCACKRSEYSLRENNFVKLVGRVHFVNLDPR